MKRLLIGLIMCLTVLLSACGTLQVTRVGPELSQASGQAQANKSSSPDGYAVPQGDLWQDLRQRFQSAKDHATEVTPVAGEVVEPEASDNSRPAPAVTAAPTLTPIPCQPRSDWPIYQVKGGDILGDIAHWTGSSVPELTQANCLANPNLLRPGQRLFVPSPVEPTPSPSPTPPPTPRPARTTRHLDPTFQLAFDYPADWVDESSEGRRRFAGEGGFVQLDALGAPYDIQMVAQNQAEHKLRPYGSQPTIELLVLSDGREARLVLPSADQPLGMEGQALLIAPYAAPVDIGGYAYNYLALTADEAHIRDLAASLTLAPPPTAIAIEAFTVSAVDVPGGKKITFNWRSYGATHGVITSGTARRFAPWWPVEASGELTVILEGTLLPDPVMNLQVYNAVSGREAYASTRLIWPCASSYFFSPAPEYCPRTAAYRTMAAYQPFEGGFMVWMRQPEAVAPTVLVFQADGGVSQYPDTWTEGQTDGEVDEQPPAGLIRPERGFGQVWADYPQVRQALGWATAPETAYEITYQAEARESIPGVAYLTLPDRAILKLIETHWEPFSPAQGS